PFSTVSGITSSEEAVRTSMFLFSSFKSQFERSLNFQFSIFNFFDTLTALAGGPPPLCRGGLSEARSAGISSPNPDCPRNIGIANRPEIGYNVLIKQKPTKEPLP
ncbi:MAG: hypothetical protein IKI02_05845, partial [Oscillospiraceae bacterium]|nr:hypothetical protein [Oscillospiraceae bacterium]